MSDFDIDKEIDKNYSAVDIDLADCKKIGAEIFAVSIIGSAPVEYLGVVGDKCFSFKSRDISWYFSIADSKNDCLPGESIRINTRLHFTCSGRYSNEKFKASYMPIEQAEKIIRSCVALWKSGLETG